MVHGGQIFAKALKKEGVECVYTLSGGHIMPILYGCREEGIKVIDVRHECTGGYAAGAYAKVTGRPGVIITTAGPGVTNVSTAMAEAMESGTPLIHIGGGSPVRENDTGPLQNVLSFESMVPFSKWSRKIMHADRIAEYVAMAFRNAMDGTPGPVYLEVAIDTLKGAFEEDAVYFPENYRAKTSAFGDPELIQKAADALLNAKKPALIIGDAARFSAEHACAVEELVNHLQMPVFAGIMARGTFADESKNELFTLGTGAIMAADVVLELAVDRNYKYGKGRAPRVNANALRIVAHPDSTKIGYNAPADIAIIAGASAAAKQILELVKDTKVDNSAWVEEARAITAKVMAPYTKAAESTISPVHPGRCASEVAKFIAEEAQDWHIICDGGDSASWMDGQSVARYPGQVVRYGPLGTIGTGPGNAIGAWSADGKPILYYTGDGSFGFYSMEFDTYARHDIPLVCVISNDSAWGMIKLSQELANAEYVGKHGHLANILHPMRAYENFPAVWGGIGIKVTKYEDIIPAIRKIRDSGMPGIVNVQVDETEVSPPTAAFSGYRKED